MKAELKPYIVFLLAGNYAQAEHYARVFLHSQQGFTYIDSVWHLRGLRGFHYAKVGNWRRRDDLPEILAMFEEREAVDITRELPDEHAQPAI